LGQAERGQQWASGNNQHAVRKGQAAATQIKTDKAASAPPQVPDPMSSDPESINERLGTCGGALAALLVLICAFAACPLPDRVIGFGSRLFRLPQRRFQFNLCLPPSF